MPRQHTDIPAPRPLSLKSIPRPLEIARYNKLADTSYWFLSVSYPDSQNRQARILLEIIHLIMYFVIQQPNNPTNSPKRFLCDPRSIPCMYVTARLVGCVCLLLLFILLQVMCAANIHQRSRFVGTFAMHALPGCPGLAVCVARICISVSFLTYFVFYVWVPHKEHQIIIRYVTYKSTVIRVGLCCYKNSSCVFREFDSVL